MVLLAALLRDADALAVLALAVVALAGLARETVALAVEAVVPALAV